VTPALVVLSPGLSTTVQDAGRIGFQRQGVPVSGALDRVALAAANIAVGNEPGTAAVEMLYQGATLEIAARSVRLACCGGALEIRAAGETRRVPPLESVTVTRAMTVRVVLAGPGIGAYLAVAGGLATPVVMGSRATYTRAGIGGCEGGPVRAGSRIPLMRDIAPGGPECRLAIPPLALPRHVRVVPGPQDDHFTADAMATFLATNWKIGPAADRMGLRLEGPQLAHARGHDITSDGIAPGAIQVPGDGRPIVLLADRQTTGGYPKIATVASADVPALGRLAPGMDLRFAAVTVAEAEQARRTLDAEIAGWPSRLQPAGDIAIDTARLLAANLIDGVMDAHGSSVGD